MNGIDWRELEEMKVKNLRKVSGTRAANCAGLEFINEAKETESE